MARAQKMVVGEKTNEESQETDAFPQFEGATTEVAPTYPEGMPPEHQKMIEQASLMARVMNARPAAEANPPKPTNERYLVTNHAPVSVVINGYMCNFRPGKIVDSVNYDLERLRQSGVKLERQP